MLLNICNLVSDGLLLSTEKGNTKMASYLDEQKMSHLYEKFILEYYRYHHPELHANPDQIKGDMEDDKIEFLPAMKTDITLKTPEKTLIIDAKYYAKTLQSQFDMYSYHSANLYQIHAYVKNLDKDRTGNVAGMQLYARTGESIQPNNMFTIGGNVFGVKILDLNLPFSAIAA